MAFRARFSPPSPMSLPASPAAHTSRRICPSSLLHPSSHAEYLLRHLEKPVTREVVHYLVCRVQQILSHTPVAEFEPEPIAVPPLETFASVLIRSTFITLPTILCAILYLDRLELSLSSRPVYNHNPTSPHCILLSVLIVASKHQNDSSLTNAAWCDAVAWSIKRCKLGKPRSIEMLIENVFSLTNIMAMERQCLDHLEFDLVVSEEEVEFALVSMLQFLADPSLSLAEQVPSFARLDEGAGTWFYGVSPAQLAGDMSSGWFESPQPSFQYLCTRRASAPAILDHQDQPAICGGPMSYAAFPSDISDGILSYPATPTAQYTANLDFDIEELYEQVEVELHNVENRGYPEELVECSAMRYPELGLSGDFDSRGRSTLSKPLGDWAMLPVHLGRPEKDMFAQPWVEQSEMPFITQSFVR